MERLRHKQYTDQQFNYQSTRLTVVIVIIKFQYAFNIFLIAIQLQNRKRLFIFLKFSLIIARANSQNRNNGFNERIQLIKFQQRLIAISQFANVFSL